MISGLAKSVVMPREQETFVTGLSFDGEDEPPAPVITATASETTIRKNASKKNRTRF